MKDGRKELDKLWSSNAGWIIIVIFMSITIFIESMLLIGMFCELRVEVYDMKLTQDRTFSGYNQLSVEQKYLGRLYEKMIEHTHKGMYGGVDENKDN